MADHIKLQVLKALTAHLEGITLANGYQHDLNGKVFRGRAVLGANEQVPILNILETPSPLDGFFADEQKTLRRDTLVLLVQGWAEDDARNPTDPVYPLLADVQRRLSDIVSLDEGSNRPRWPGVYMLKGLISDMDIGQDAVRPAQEGVSAKAFFYMPIRITLPVNLIDPTEKVE